MLKLTGIPVFCTHARARLRVYMYRMYQKWFHPSCHSTPNSIAKNYEMPRLSILNEIIFLLYFHFFSPQTIPFTDQTQILKRPLHSRIKVTLSPRTIPFTDHSLHGPFTDYNLQTNVTYRLHAHQPFTDHSIHGPLSRTYIKPTDQCHIYH